VMEDMARQRLYFETSWKCKKKHVDQMMLIL
jgi:hypothetical protein